MPPTSFCRPSSLLLAVDMYNAQQLILDQQTQTISLWQHRLHVLASLLDFRMKNYMRKKATKKCQRKEKQKIEKKSFPPNRTCMCTYTLYSLTLASQSLFHFYEWISCKRFMLTYEYSSILVLASVICTLVRCFIRRHVDSSAIRLLVCSSARSLARSVCLFVRSFALVSSLTTSLLLIRPVVPVKRCVIRSVGSYL